MNLKKINALYEEGKPQMSDEEFDNKFGENTPVVTSKNYNVRHWKWMPSIKKKVITRATAKEYKLDEGYIAMPKCDGIAVELVYVQGKLDHISTRGDGYMGKAIDITFAKYLVPVENVNCTEVYGEIIHKKGRNVAAGICNRKYIWQKDMSELQFIAYDCSYEINTIGHKMKFLKSIGFDTVEVTSDFKSLIPALTNEYKYPTDGIVIRPDNEEVYLSYGKTQHHYKGALALKVNYLRVTTKVIDFAYSMSICNNIIFTLQVEPVQLAGKTIRKVSATPEEAMSLRVGSEVSIYLANGIVPKLVKEFTREPLKIIDKCPFCGSDVKVSKNPLKVTCKGNCPAGITARAVRVAKLLKIGIGKKSIEKNRYSVNDIVKMYNSTIGKPFSKEILRIRNKELALSNVQFADEVEAFLTLIKNIKKDEKNI